MASCETTVTVDVMRYSDAATLARVEMARDEYAAYEAEHEGGTGAVRAGDVLDAAMLEQAGIDAGETVYLER